MSIKDFTIISKLGEGAYSSVYKVKRRSDQNEYALKKVKLLNLSSKEKENALNEVRILASIRQPNVICYKECFLDEKSNSLCIVMEFCNHGDLYQKIVRHQKSGKLFKEEEIWNIFIQMVQGLKALHDIKIYHRDMKSANIFLNKDGTVKLGDMNVSKIAKKGLLYTQTGTPYYASPEVWKDKPYDHKSDVWSLGCVLYEMTTLQPPFHAKDMEGLYKKVIKGHCGRIPTHFSQDLSNIIRCLLQVTPALRPDCNKILRFPAVLKRLNETILREVAERSPKLLRTILFPKKLHYLTGRLPEANYQQLHTVQIDKDRYINTLSGYPKKISKDGKKSYKNFGNQPSKNNKESHNRLPTIKKQSNQYLIKKDKSPYRLSNHYEIDDRKLIAHKKKRQREKIKEQQRKKLLKKYQAGGGNGTNLKKIYGMGGDSALALKLLNNLNSKKQKYLDQKKQNQLLQLYSHKKSPIMNSRRQHHSPQYRKGSSSYNAQQDRDGSLPQLKQGVKLPQINQNILYTPNLQNLNKAKISQIERTYVSNDNLSVLKRRKQKVRQHNKNRKQINMNQYKKEAYDSDIKLLQRKIHKRSLMIDKENHLSNALSIQPLKKL